MKKIITVCKGNIHRSVIGASCINKELSTMGLSGLARCDSRGTNGTMGVPMSTGINLYSYPRAITFNQPYLDELNILIPESQISTPITLKDIQDSELILAMDNAVLSKSSNSLLVQFPEYANKMILFSSLVGLSKDIRDVGDILDGKIHGKVVREISRISHHGIHKLVKLLNIY